MKKYAHYQVTVLDDGLVAPQHEDDIIAPATDLLQQCRRQQLPST